MKPFSLRSRLLFGTVLWTIGLVIMASAVLIAVIEFRPRVSIHLSIHDFFKRVGLDVGLFCMVAGLLQFGVVCRHQQPSIAPCRVARGPRSTG